MNRIQFLSEVKAHWSNLADDQLDVIARKRIERTDKIQEADSMTEDEASGDHPQAAGYSTPGCTCPCCDGAVYRIPRRLVDSLVSAFVPVRRYRCRSWDCGWEGNLRVRRQPLLIRGPW